MSLCPIPNPPRCHCLGCSYSCLRLPARWALASLATASNVSSGSIHVYMWLCNTLWSLIARCWKINLLLSHGAYFTPVCTWIMLLFLFSSIHFSTQYLCVSWSLKTGDTLHSFGKVSVMTKSLSTMVSFCTCVCWLQIQCQMWNSYIRILLTNAGVAVLWTPTIIHFDRVV